jgi:hypothetical protein
LFFLCDEENQIIRNCWKHGVSVCNKPHTWVYTFLFPMTSLNLTSGNLSSKEMYSWSHCRVKHDTQKWHKHIVDELQS